MSVTETSIAYFANRYKEATGKLPNRFFCPITLQDDSDSELCDGHILCKGIKTANRSTIVQRADVDNRFGTLFERDFVTLANFRSAGSEELLRVAKDLHITGPSGEKMPAFFAGPEARVRFQQLEMYDDKGDTVAAPFLRSHALEAGQYKQLEVEWMFYIHKYGFTAAMLKSAYLTLFKIFGYTWVFDSSGDKVRRTLVASLNEQDRTKALNQFADFEGSCWIAGSDLMSNTPDSLGDGRMMFHFAEGDAKSGLLFGVSCLFWINDILLAVSVPSCQRVGHYFVSWNYYQEFIKKQSLCHNIHLGTLIDEVVRIDPNPLSLQRVDEFPPNQKIAVRLSPCPATS